MFKYFNELNQLMNAHYLEVVNEKSTPSLHKNKNVKLDEVFTQCTLQLNNCFNLINDRDQNYDQCIQELNTLKKNSKIRYSKFYSKSRKYTVIILQNFFSSLPKFISNYTLNRFPLNFLLSYTLNSKLVQAEYMNCKNCIKEKIKHFEILKEEEANKIVQLNKIKPELEKIEALCERVNVFLNLSEGMHYHFKKFIDDVSKLNFKINTLDYPGNKKELLLSYHLPESLACEIFPDQVKEGNKQSRIMQLLKATSTDQFRNFICQLTDINFTNKLFNSFQEIITFNVDCRDVLHLTKNNIRQRENCLESFQGIIKIELSDGSKIINLEKMYQVLQEKKTFKPCQLIIKLPEDQQLNDQLIDELQKITSLIPSIQIEGMNQLDFNQFSLDKQSQLLDLFSFTDWATLSHSKIILPRNIAEWQDEQINDLAHFFSGTELDLSHLPLNELNRVLSFFPRMKALTFNQSELSDVQIFEFINQGYFKNLIKLDLEGCDHLTTDILPDLIKIETLTQFKGTNLILGETQLPKLDNPFQVKIFYVSVKATHSLANTLYTGPVYLASLFQIPLARQSAKFTFNDRQTYLDPTSVSHWLYKNDYLGLEPQLSIETIFVDEIPDLNDDNLCSFIQKFPQVKELSLYASPFITDKGVLELLATTPQLKKLDLTNCEKITLNLFKEPLLLQNLEEIRVSSSIDPKEIAKLPEYLRSKIKLKPTFLKISNEELKAGLSLKAVLNNHLPLNHLSHLDLSDCKSLKFADFQYLIECFNMDIQVNDSGYLKINPNKLNITHLNLTKSSFTPSFFTPLNKNLNHLQQLIIDNPNSNRLNKLKSQYPHLQFHEKYSPLVKTFDINQVLSSCERFLFTESAAEKNQLAQEQFSNRILIELFGEEADNQELLQLILSQSITKLEEPTCLATFSDNDGINFSLPQNELYFQSPLIREELRIGGVFYKSTVAHQNQNFTAEAGHILTHLLKKNCLPNEMSLQGKIAAAEIVNEQTLNIPHFYKKLLSSIHTEIRNLSADFLLESQPFDLLIKLIALEDKKALALFELKLSSIINENRDLRERVGDLLTSLPYLNTIVRLINHQTYILNENYLFNYMEINPDLIIFYRNIIEQQGVETLINQLIELPKDVQISIIYPLIESIVQSLEVQANM